MWKMIGKPTTVIADHSLVERFKSMEPCHGDRTLSDQRMRRLSAALADGTFRTCSWASALCAQDGKEYRINGKHSSHAMAEMNGTLPKVFVTIERYEADTLEDVADLYATFDASISTRTGKDICKAFAGTDLTLNEIPDAMLGLCASAIAFGLQAAGELKARPTAEQRARLMLRNKDFIQWFSECIGARKPSNRFLHRAGVVAAMFACYRIDKQQAAVFWSSVLNGTDPDPKAPSRMIERFLRDTIVTEKGAQDECYTKSVNAWNASRQGITVKNFRYTAGAELPKAI